MTTVAPRPTPPLEEAISFLRRIGLALAGAAIRREPAPSLARLITRRDVALLLPFEGFHNALPLTRRTIWPWLKQGAWMFQRELAPRWTPPTLSRELQTAAERSLLKSRGGEQWDLLVRIWAERVVGGISPRWLGDPFWPLVGEAAWGEAAFQLQIVELLDANLRRRVLFTPGGTPTLTVAPATFWTLIALAEIGRPYAWRLMLRWRATMLGLRRLQEVAVRAALQPGWADVWDQWLIGEALRLWPKAAERPTPELQNALQALPLLSRLNTASPVPQQEPSALVALGWEQRVPPWIDTLARWDREQPASPARI